LCRSGDSRDSFPRDSRYDIRHPHTLRPFSRTARTTCALHDEESAMAVNVSDMNSLRGATNRALQQNWKLFLAEGIVLVLLGIAAVALPPIASLAVTLLIGWVFLISGAFGLYTTFAMRGAPGFVWALVSALIGIAAGLVLIVWPASGVVSLTIVLAVFFAMEGIASILFALDHRRELSGRWGWMLASGVLDLIIAGIVFAGLPGTAAWAIGLLVGINMVMGGSALIGMALHARDAKVA
jgi:uncharacterized membrane protein HdeD (DUF308 family)